MLLSKQEGEQLLSYSSCVSYAQGGELGGRVGAVSMLVLNVNGVRIGRGTREGERERTKQIPTTAF